jgi:deoxycytidylate deaminase/dephospho-CoA kinase
MARLIIGVTGPLGAGRSTAAEHLGESGFDVRRLSDILRAEGKKRGNPNPKIENLQDLGDELRREKGPATLVETAIAASSGDRVALDGIKNPAEVQWLDRTVDRFYLLAIDASRNARENRKVATGQGYLSPQEFDHAERRDRAETDAWGVLIQEGQQVERCVRMADFVLWNDELLLRGRGGGGAQDGHLDSLHRKIGRMVETIERPERYRPSDPELFMAHAVLASRASECMQRKVGAVLAGNGGPILAVGRNDTPSQLKSCRRQYGVCYRQRIRDEVLAELKERFLCICGGTLQAGLRCESCAKDHSEAFERFRNLDLCRALHAEEAALLQLARTSPEIRGELHLFTTTFPCSLCAMKIVQSNIDTVFYIDPYPSQESYQALRDGDKRVEHFEGFTLRGIQKLWGEA